MGARTAGEKDQAAAVSLEALDIYGEGFGREICSPRVNADTNGRGEFSGYFGFLFDEVSATRIPRHHLRLLGLLMEQAPSVVNSREGNYSGKFTPLIPQGRSRDQHEHDDCI